MHELRSKIQMSWAELRDHVGPRTDQSSFFCRYFGPPREDCSGEDRRFISPNNGW